jgi:hemoglobin-like flavoprotein
MSHYETFNRSFWRVTPSIVGGVAFVDAFLDALLRSSDEIASKFDAAGRERMSNALLHSIIHLAAYSQSQVPTDALRGIARRHSRTGRNVAPDLYDILEECLVQTVGRYDPEYTDEIGEAWRAVLAPGLEYMKSMYDS